MPRLPRAFARLLPFLAALASAAPAAHAATRTWPVLIGGVGCTGTLQQCIDGAAAGDTVRIVADDLFLPDAYTAIGEDVLIDKSLTLEASPGIDGVFAPGRRIDVVSPTTGPVTVTLRRLVVRAGRVRVVHRSDAAASYTLDRLRVEETSAQGAECAVEFDDMGSGAPSFALGDSTLTFRTRQSINPGGVCLLGRGGAWQAAIFRNRIDAYDGALTTGIGIGGTNGGSTTVSGNQLFVRGAFRGIRISQNAGSGANVVAIRDNLVTGQAASGTDAAIGVIPMASELRIVNNTVVRNSTGITIGYVDGHASTGRISNNIVAHHQAGLVIDTRFTTMANERNLAFGNTFSSSGTDIITSDPRFAGRGDFRLQATSPARDAGLNGDVATLFGIAFDADGERRIANGLVDLGAFERTGDQSIAHLASVGTVIANTSRLDGLQDNGLDENVILTPLRTPGSGTEREETLGVYQDFDGDGVYFAFHEDVTVDLTPGRRIHAFVPDGGATGFLHTTTSGSVVDAYSRISHPALDSKPSAIAFVTHNWNPGGAGGVYHDHRLGLDYVAPNWYLSNQDDAPMLSGRAFNIVVAPEGSPNAFVRPVGSTPLRELRLEHPLLDDVPCATLQVSRASATFNDTPFALEYRPGGAGAPGHWFIVAEGAGTPTFPADAAFNVMVSGTQSHACRIAELFGNGFE